MRFIFFLLFFQARLLFGQQSDDNVLKITADLKNLKDSPRKVSVMILSIDGTTSYDTCSIKGGQLSFITHVKEPKFLNFTFLWKKSKSTLIKFWTGASNYEFQFDSYLQPKIQTKFQYSREFAEMESDIHYTMKMRDSLLKNIDYERQSFEMAQNEITRIKDSLNTNIEEDIFKDNVIKFNASPLGLYSLWKYAMSPSDCPRIRSKPVYIETLYQMLDKEIRRLPSAKSLLTKIRTSKAIANGKKYLPELTLMDTTGKKGIAFADYKGKYLLIDFWASWCKPCRDENPSLIKAYQNFNSKGFHILSVTVDRQRDKDKWLEALYQDGIQIWQNVSDFNGKAKSIFDIKVIPSNFLIDPSGKIIAQDLRGDMLGKKLSELFETQ
ncbi:TlpA family protein disulfide reductase [Pedobacter sp. AW1-32]|uniref:TlpA family protein disulfide reductase n=1 Tax=Pedobacter sp. AW1-32 TaxID=3383026 RepID=UPI003FEE7E0C